MPHPLVAAMPAPARQFILFGGLHLSILAFTILCPLLLSWLSRQPSLPQLGRWLSLTLAALLVADRLVALPIAVHEGRIDRWPEALPMHLCDWASFAVIIALIWRGQLAYEFAYYWGLSGTVQALLTPDTAEAPGSPLFISFFVSHCTIVMSVLFMTWAFRRPRPGSPWKIWLWSQLYLAAAGLVNWPLHTNFGYLAGKARQSSLLDVLAPWPWYVLEMDLVALLLFGVLYLPFAFDSGRPREAAGK